MINAAMDIASKATACATPVGLANGAIQRFLLALLAAALLPAALALAAVLVHFALIHAHTLMMANVMMEVLEQLMIYVI
jgi:hypothetical protein